MPSKNKIEEEVKAIVEETVVEEEAAEDFAAEEDQRDGFYDSNGNEVLFPDGPKMEDVEEWKSRFGAVYLTEFDEEIFIWRTLTRKEYKDIMKIENADTYYKEERICEKCILWPQGYNFLKMTHGKAGIPSLLSEQIMDKSGFTAKTGALRI